MISELDLNSLGDLHRHGQKPYSVLVAYEDLASWRRAVAFYTHLTELSWNPSSLKVTMWKYNLLAVPALLAMAVDDAVAADMIVLAGHESESLPQSVRKWMSLWFQNKEDAPYRVVFLFDRGFDQADPRAGIPSPLFKRANEDLFLRNYSAQMLERTSRNQGRS